jgi:hypothetical protein
MTRVTGHIHEEKVLYPLPNFHIRFPHHNALIQSDKWTILSIGLQYLKNRLKSICIREFAEIDEEGIGGICINYAFDSKSIVNYISAKLSGTQPYL